MIKSDDAFFLDFLRGGGAFLVLIAHVQQILINPTWMPFSLNEKTEIAPFLYSQLGAFGVMVFFVLSGFLISYSIFGNLRYLEGRGFDSILYFKKRVMRLYPPLLFSQLVVLLLFAVVYFFGVTSSDVFTTGKELYIARSEVEFNAIDYIGSMFFLNTVFDGIKSPVLNGPLWSVAQEFWFYVIAGLFVMSFFYKAIIILLASVLAVLWYQGDTFFFYGLAVWLVGCLVAILHITGFYKKNRYLVYAIFFITLVVWIALIFQNENLYIRYRQKFAFGVSFAFLMLILLESPSFKRRLAATWVAKKVSDIAAYSYTLYLIHFPILIVVFIFTNRYTQADKILLIAVSGLSITAVMWFSAKVALLVEGSFREAKGVRVPG